MTHDSLNRVVQLVADEALAEVAFITWLLAKGVRAPRAGTAVAPAATLTTRA